MAGVVETLASLGFPEAVDDAQLLQRDGSYTRAVEFLLDMIDAPLASSFRGEMGSGSMLEALGLAAPGEGDEILRGEVGEEESWVLLEDLSTLASQAQSGTVRPIGRQDELMGMVARQAGGSSKHGGALFAHGVTGMFAFPLGEAERKGRAGAAALQVDPGMLEDCLEMVQGEHRLTVEESERAAGFLQALVRQRSAFDGTDADVRGGAAEVAAVASDLRAAALDLNDCFEGDLRGTLQRLQRPEQQTELGAVARRVRGAAGQLSLLLENIDAVRATSARLAALREERARAAEGKGAAASGARGPATQVGTDAWLSRQDRRAETLGRAARA